MLLLLPLLWAGCTGSGEPLHTGAECRATLVIDSAAEAEPVQFVSAAPPADQVLLNRWCETVGAAVYDPAPAPADTPGQRMDSLAIVSWNVRVGGGDVVRFVDDLRAGRLTNGEPVREFVLLLQEVFRASAELPGTVDIDVPERIAPAPPQGPRLGIERIAEQLGLALLYIPSMRNGVGTTGAPFEDRGNAVLATVPLDDPRAIELPFERQRRVAAAARVFVPDRLPALRVVSAHLDNRSRFTRIIASAGVGRLRQAEGLMRRVKRDDPLIVAGDMNTWGPDWTERAIPFLKSELPDSPPGTGQPTYIKPVFERRIDYIFADLPDSWRIHYRRIDNRYGSDHHPLLGWVVF